jgi:hypothetical protein
MMKKIALIFLLISSLVADEVVSFETGKLKVFVFIGGEPIQGVKVELVGGKKRTTDSDGMTVFLTSVGEHQVILHSDKIKAIDAYAISTKVAVDEETQVIIEFEKGSKDARVLEDIAKFKFENQVSKEELERRAQLGKGFIEGVVLNSEDNTPIEGAKIFIKGSDIEAQTDKEGKFNVEIFEGNHALSFIHSKYSTRTVDEIIVDKDMTTTKEIRLTPAGLELDEFVVLVPHIEGGVASLVDEKKNTDVVGDVMGSEQFSKAGDSSAAGALKRAAGLTLVGGKYVYIRGLGERYSSTLFNGLDMPSPEPTKRVVPLDMFPTSVIQSIMIQKTYSADMPATFGGGVIQIRSKDVPSKDFIKISVGTKYSDGSTFTTQNGYQQGGLDVLGFDDGTRALPDSVITATNDLKPLQDSLGGFRDGYTTQELRDFGSDLASKNSYNLTDTYLLPGYKVSVSFGKRYELQGGSNLGIVGAYSLSNDSDFVTKDKKIYSSGSGNYVLSQSEEIADTTQEYSHGGLLGMVHELDENIVHRYTLLYLHSAENLTRVKTYEDENNLDLKKMSLYWSQRDLLLNQLHGEYKLDSFDFNWATQLGYANRYEPGSIDYTYEMEQGTDIYVLRDQGPIQLLRSNMNDLMNNTKFDLKIPFVLNEIENNNISFGGNFLYKHRDLDSRRYKVDYGNDTLILDDSLREGEIDTLLSDANFQSENFVLQTAYKASDTYTAYQMIYAGYLATTISPIESIKLAAGARYESSVQTLEAEASTGETQISSLKSNDLLPAATLTYKVFEDFQIRAAYSKSVSRPDFREFVESDYVDPVTADKVVGYKDLQYTNITNYDVRFEYYFDGVDNISFALFRKEFIHPIEAAIRALDTPVTVFRNAESATSNGIEFDLRKGFGFISHYLEDFYISGNYSLIDSSVVLDEDSEDSVIQQLTTNDRPMQGQSPYTINVTLSYDSIDNGRTISVMYNEFGPRIMRLGTEGELDYYEQPFHQLDLVWIEKPIDGLSIKLKIANMLDDDVIWKQGPKVVYEYKKGISGSLSASYKF